MTGYSSHPEAHADRPWPRLSDELDRRHLAQTLFILRQAQLGSDHLGQGVVPQVIVMQAIYEQLLGEYR